MTPEELKASLAALSAKLEKMGVSLTALRTLVIKHYSDVHALLRLYERRIMRLEDKVGVPHAIKPERKPKALKDPP